MGCQTVFNSHSSSLSRELGPPPKSPLKKLCLGASGSSLLIQVAPIISGMLSRNADDIVNLVNSEANARYMPCPFVLKQIVRAILLPKNQHEAHPNQPA